MILNKGSLDIRPVSLVISEFLDDSGKLLSRLFLIELSFKVSFVLFLLFSVIIYKGEKSYYTYYAFLSKFPNNFTEEYLDSAIKQTDLSEAIKLLKRHPIGLKPALLP